MIDIQTLRRDAAQVESRLKTRGFVFDRAGYEALEARRKALQTRAEALQAQRNALSKQIGQAKGKGEDASALLAEVNAVTQEQAGIPAELPKFIVPELNWQSARFLLIPSLTLAILGAIESLLCARVADSMTGDRHDPNQELMAQGIANLVTSFFGGMPATGTIARTVTNIKSGASTPVAGMVHAVSLLLIVLIAAPLAASVPLPTLAAVLIFVAWNMGEWREFARLRNHTLAYRVTLMAVFLLTVVFDLTVAVEVGLVTSLLTFIYSMSSLSRSERMLPAGTTATDTDSANKETELPQIWNDNEMRIWRLHGTLFFGAVRIVEQIADNLPERHAEHKQNQTLLDTVYIRAQRLRHFRNGGQVGIDRKRHQGNQHRHQNRHLLFAQRGGGGLGHKGLSECSNETNRPDIS